MFRLAHLQSNLDDHENQASWLAETDWRLVQQDAPRVESAFHSMPCAHCHCSLSCYLSIFQHVI